jgi:16S rRNA (cytosine1402-N4)-methyltransferase
VSSDLFHIPVLRREAVDAILTDAEGCYVDGTVGGGGHAEELCTRLRGRGRIICIDADEEALSSARKRLQQCAERVVFVRANFADVGAVLRAEQVVGINGFLLDLGVSSHQLDVPERGFSFRGDERLDMRLDQRRQWTAWDLVNTAEEAALSKVLWDYGEEREARRIARRIIAARPVNTTGDLRAIVEQTVNGKFRVKSLARVFQALRIAVNGELDNLRRALAAGTDALLPGGRLVVISYHSLEDRIVKEFFRSEAQTPVERRDPFARGVAAEGRLRLVTRKAVAAGEEELSQNPRARSAKLRVVERTHVGTDRT